MSSAAPALAPTVAPAAPGAPVTKKALTADHPTWCPGCGDFAVLAAFYKFLQKRNPEHEKTVTLAQIGCPPSPPYYVHGHRPHLIPPHAVPPTPRTHHAHPAPP